MKLIPREAWTTRKVNFPTNITPQFGGVAIHYVGGKGLLTPTTHLKCASIVKAIEDHHIRENGWQGVAYNFLVCQHGYVFEGRGLYHRSAANRSVTGNQNYYAVCGLVNYNDLLTEELLEGIYETCNYLRNNGNAGEEVLGHRNLVSTDCPGPLYRFVQSGRFRRGKEQEDNSYYPGPYCIGDTGEQIIKIQKHLLNFRFKIPVDGEFGPRTLTAIKNFQKCHHLPITGEVDEETWNALF